MRSTKSTNVEFGSTKTFSETDINMLEFLIDNIFVMFGGCVFQQSAYPWVQTVLRTLLADLFELMTST
jgi:hypothetical protein